MMKSLFSFCSLGVGVAVLVLAFNLSGCDESADSSADALATISNGEIRVLASEASLKDLFKDVEGPRREMLTVPATIEEARVMAEPLGFTFDTFEIDGEGSAFYAIARGTTEEGNCFTVAKELGVDGNRVGPMKRTASGDLARAETGETNTCTGVACNECSFERNGDGKITGCQACAVPSLPNGHCNHTVTSGG